MKKKSNKEKPVPAKADAAPSIFVGLIEKTVSLGPLFLLGVAPLIYLKLGGEFENNPKMAFLQWGIVLLALIQLLPFQKQEAFVWKRTPLDLPILFFYGFCWLSLVFSTNPHVATLLLLHWFGALVFFFFLVHTLKNETDVDDFFFVIGLSALMVSIVGCLQVFYGFSLVPQMSPPASTFSNRNMASQFIAMAVPVTAGSILLVRELHMKLISGLSLSVSLFFLNLTRTRSALISVIFIAVLVFLLFLFSAWLKKHVRVRKGVFGLLLVVAISVCLLFFQPARKRLHLDKQLPEISSLIKKADKGTAKLRFNWWKNTVFIAEENFWTGIGLANFKLVYPKYHRVSRIDRTFTERKQVNRVHNDHLQLFSELGFFGFCMYVWIFITAFYLFYKILKKANNRETRLRAICLQLGIVIFLIVAFFTFPLERAMPPILLFTYLGLTAYLYVSCSSEHENFWRFPFQRTIRICAAAVLILFLCSSFFFLRKIVISDKYFVSGMALAKRDRREAACAALQKAKIFSMWNYNITSLLGQNYLQLGKYRKAIREYEESFRANPYNTNGILNMGYCYLKLNDYDEAERYFNKYISLLPDSPKVINNLGIVYFSKKDYKRAEAYYAKARDLNPKYAEPHYNLANLYRQLGDLEKAITEYKKTLELDPKMFNARIFLCDVYMEKGAFEQAHEVVQPLLENRKTLGQAHLLKGNIFQKQGKPKKALHQYFRAMRLSPKNPVAYQKIGLAQFSLKNYSEAERFFNKALSLNPNIIQALTLLAQIHVRRQDDDGARKLYERALALNPKLYEARFNLGNIFRRAGMYREASVAYSRSLKTAPHFAPAHYNLATILMKFGRNEEALFHFKKSAEKPSPHINETQVKKLIAELEKKLGRK